MARSQVQLEIEDWVRRRWMPKVFRQEFHRERLRLSSGGVFDFDAVSDDGKIVATISTSGSKTARGKNASGKMQKIRADMFFLLLVPDVERRIVVLTEADMLERCNTELKLGRVPRSVEFVQVEIPRDLAEKLTIARATASREVSPTSDPD